MHRHPAEVWNAIAETQDLRTSWAAAMFPLPQEVLDEEMAAEMKRLTKEAGSETVALAYLAVMPTLWEAPAVQAFKATGDPLGDGLTVMETVQMAVIAASRDYGLTTQDQIKLEKLLQTAPTA